VSAFWGWCHLIYEVAPVAATHKCWQQEPPAALSLVTQPGIHGGGVCCMPQVAFVWCWSHLSVEHTMASGHTNCVSPWPFTRRFTCRFSSVWHDDVHHVFVALLPSGCVQSWAATCFAFLFLSSSPTNNGCCSCPLCRPCVLLGSVCMTCVALCV
jgi:hypothetical protein